MECIRVPLDFGTRPGAVGGHTGRTIMFKELHVLLSVGSREYSYIDFKNAVLQQNILGANTQNNRKITWGYLQKLYGFRDTPLFRNFKSIWNRTPESDRPGLALTVALSRDILLLKSGSWISSLPLGTETPSNFFAEGLRNEFLGKYSLITTASISRNLASSWKQAGWIDAHKNIRIRGKIGAGALSIALFISWTNGLRGDQLLASPLSQILVKEIEEPFALIWEANRSNFLNFYQSGGIIDIRFPGWLTQEEEEVLHEQT
jgi:hypothetical protein